MIRICKYRMNVKEVTKLDGKSAQVEKKSQLQMIHNLSLIETFLVNVSEHH